MRQQGLALTMYADDYDEYFVNPWNVEKHTNNGNDCGEPGCDRNHRGVWPVLMNAYQAAPIGTWTGLAGTEVGQDPKSRNNAWTCPQVRPGWSEFGQGTNKGGGGTYTMNPVLYQFEYTDGGDWSTSHKYSMNWAWTYKSGLKSQRKVKRPTTTIAMSEGYTWYNMWQGKTYTVPACPPAFHHSLAGYTIPARSNKLWPYHAGQGNYLCLDGHVVDIRQTMMHAPGPRRDMWRWTLGATPLGYID
jgi:prepilin-type processing-associated H-X9-DG protein